MTEQVFTSCTVGGPIFVYVKDGKITRIRPIVFDETDAKSWTIEAKGRKFSPPRKANLDLTALMERVRFYTENRLKYPLKRVDFDPKGDRHPEMRGKSTYERISWNEAYDIVVGEIKRIRENYGPAAVCAMMSSHHSWGLHSYKLGAFSRFFELLGHTAVFNDPDSWEGWHWGATHAWGFYWRLGVAGQWDLLEDALRNTELIVHWSNDPDTTCRHYWCQESAIWRIWLQEMGIKQVFIDPFCNYTATIMGDKWIAPRPGTDAAMAEAIAYIWLKDDTYDKEYVATHTVGFEEFKKHIMGENDGVPQTPEWAAEISGVPARTITALARDWASKRTSLGCGGIAGVGGACRQAYSHEWTRLMVLLMAMQGLGKPGVNMFAGAGHGAPYDERFRFPGYSDGALDIFSLVAKKGAVNPVSQRIYRLLLPEAVLNPPINWLSEGFCGQSLDQQFVPFTYPEPGSPEIKMLYRYGGAFISTMTDTNRWTKMYQSPKLELVVNQDCWWNTETGFADIILPACTNLERSDISEWTNVGGYGSGMSGTNHRIIVYQKKCIEPLWESRSDYRIFCDLAERLGIKEEYTEGNSEEDWNKKFFEYSSLPDYISYEDFKKKGYFVVPLADDYKPAPTLRWFYEGRECDTPEPMNPKKGTDRAKELGTDSGKIEFVSQSLLRHMPDDEERPPLPRYIPSWEGYDSELAKKYPLQLIVPHPRYSFHSQYDVDTRWIGDIPGHRVLKDDYYWRVIRIHPSDASARNIRHGDIIKLYNDRGATLGIAQLTERLRPGVIHCFASSAMYDPLEPGKPGTISRGGAVNILTPSRFMSKNAPGMACNSTLVEISKWEA